MSPTPIATPAQTVPIAVAAAFALIARGHRVEQQDIPGLWRIDDGPEITSGQLVQVANTLPRP